MISWRLALVLGALLGGIAAAAGPEAPPRSTNGPSITVTILEPMSGALVGNELFGRAEVTSTFALSSVTAEVEDRSVALAPDGDDFTGTLSLAGLARGPKTLTITATDVFDGQGGEAVSVVLDNPPEISVDLPWEQAVARPALRFTATCTDDDPAGCTAIELCWASCSSGPGLAVAGGELDETVDFSQREGRAFRVRIRGVDSAGQVDDRFRHVYVESSPLLRRLAAVDGRIRDAETDRPSSGARRRSVSRARTASWRWPTSGPAP